jgi:predicted permease
MVLLVGAGLLMKSFAQLQTLGLGIEPQNVATFEINLPAARYSDPARRIQFHQEFQDKLRAVPGVRAAGAISKLPVSGEYHRWGYTYDTPSGRSDFTSIQVRVVEGDYFDALGINLLYGRYFERGDRTEGLPVVMINQSAAEHAFSDSDAVGKQIYMGPIAWTVVGVVEDVAHDHRGSFARKLYMPHTQYGDNRNWALTQVVATDGQRDDLVTIARRELAAIDPDLVVHNASKMVDVMGREIAQERFALMLMGIFAAVALTLAAIGMYGVLAYSVNQRTQEIGIRMALGARSTQVRGIVVGQGITVAAVGIAVGLVGALALSRLLESILFGVSVTDPTIFATVAGTLGIVALLAAYLPARRATRVDPMEALRNE